MSFRLYCNLKRKKKGQQNRMNEKQLHVHARSNKFTTAFAKTKPAIESHFSKLPFYNLRVLKCAIRTTFDH